MGTKKEDRKKHKEMNDREKMLLLDILMSDIRSSWDLKRNKRLKDKRVWRCLELIDDMQKIANDTNHKLYSVASCIPWQKFYETMGIYLTGRFEGRFMRKSVCNGGYEGLYLFHHIRADFSLRSKEFSSEIKTYCRVAYKF